LTLGRAYSVGSEPESKNPLPQAYVEARHTLQVSPYNLSKCVYPLFSLAKSYYMSSNFLMWHPI
jgi:hypothetical protein